MEGSVKRERPPRPTSPPNFNFHRSVNVSKPVVKGSISRRRALSPAPEKPMRSPSHRAKYLGNRSGDILPSRHKVKGQPLPRTPENTDINGIHSSDDSQSQVSPDHTAGERTSRTSTRSKKKGRAPTPARRPVDKSEVTTNELNSNIKSSVKYIDEEAKPSINTTELEQVLRTRLSTVNAQLQYIDGKVEMHPVTPASICSVEGGSAALQDGDSSADTPEGCTAADEAASSHRSPSATHRVRFNMDDIVVINDIIGDVWNDYDLDSSADDNLLSDSDTDSEADNETCNGGHSEGPAAYSSTETLCDSEERNTLPEVCDSEYRNDLLEVSDGGSVDDHSTSNQVGQSSGQFAMDDDEKSDNTTELTPAVDPPASSSTAEQSARASRSRERRRKDSAPVPPLIKAPSLKNIALRMDSKSYQHSISKNAAGIAGIEETGTVVEPLQRTTRSKSVDRTFDKPRQRKMPPAKNFFKTFLRKGKSKPDVSATEFEVVTRSPDPRDHVEEEEDLQMEGKLPKEFLDTWVSSTTNQLMDEMDVALKGVWPYDKKEDTSNYRRKSMSNNDIIESLDDSQTTLKRRSKHQLQVPSSAWSDRGGADTLSSNFILKEKTKKSSPSTPNGSLRSHQVYASQPSLNTLTLQKPGKKSPAASRELRSSREMSTTELDGSIPKTKFREQFLQKLQREGQLPNGGAKDHKVVSPNEATVSGATLTRKKNRSSELGLAAHNGNQQWDSKSQVSSILKNGSNNSTPNGTVSKSKKVPPVASHGRQSSVPSSTYSGSSSGQSGEFRGKEELIEGKISPSSSNPHDSGYESGTVRSRKEVLSLANHQDIGYESATMRPRKEVVSEHHPKDAGHEFGTMMRPRREVASTSAEYATLKRVKRSPTLSVNSRSTPRGASSAIDSIALCFDQLTSMNVSTLQQLCANYIQTQKPITAPETTPRWHDIGLIDELQPLFSSTKLVLYKGYWRNNPRETMTVMLSLREPVKFQPLKANLLKTSVTFEANVASHLIPSSLYAGKKLMTPQPTAQVGPTAAVIEKAQASPRPSSQPKCDIPKPVLKTQLSVDDTLLTGTRQHASFRPVEPSERSESVSTGYKRDSVFTNLTSNDSMGSMESMQEQAAVDSILLAVAGEDESAVSQVPKVSSPATFKEKQDSRFAETPKETPKQPKRTPSTWAPPEEIKPPTPKEITPAVPQETTSTRSSTLNDPKEMTPNTTNTKEGVFVSSKEATTTGFKDTKIGAPRDSTPISPMETPSFGLRDTKSTTPALIKNAEPVKLAPRLEAFTSPPLKRPVAEKFGSGRTGELSSTAKKLNGYDRFLPGLKTAGLVKNRIANLNNNNNNGNSEDEDCDFDPLVLNRNHNNNMDDMMPSGSDGDFTFASHLLEMAGGDMNQPQRDEDDSDSATNPSPRGVEGSSGCLSNSSFVQGVTCHVTILPNMQQVESIKTYIERLKAEQRSKEDLEMDIIFVLLQILNIIFGLHESQLRLDSISTSDFLVVTDETNVSTVHCHMINVTQAPNQKIGLTCEKLRMFLMQISHSTSSLQKSVIFTTVDDMVQNAEDSGDLRTISAILQYLLWGPKEDEVKVITLAEHRRQAFELWLQLARGKLLSSLALQPIDNLKAQMVTNFLANTNGSELFKITKLLNTY